MLVLDTDAITIIQRGSGPRYEALVRLLASADDSVYATVVSVDEQVHGALAEVASNDPKIRVRGYRRLRNLVDDYAKRPLLDYNEAAESIFDRLKGIKGRPSTKDLRIAAIALLHGATLVTGNVRDFEKVPMLNVMPLP